MLRIYVHDQIPVTSVALEGKLVGPRVEELEQYWEIALVAHPGRIMSVDLAAVTLIDNDGRALLARMLRTASGYCRRAF